MGNSANHFPRRPPPAVEPPSASEPTSPPREGSGSRLDENPTECSGSTRDASVGRESPLPRPFCRGMERHIRHFTRPLAEDVMELQERMLNVEMTLERTQPAALAQEGSPAEQDRNRDQGPRPNRDRHVSRIVEKALESLYERMEALEDVVDVTLQQMRRRDATRSEHRTQRKSSYGRPDATSPSFRAHLSSLFPTEDSSSPTRSTPSPNAAPSPSSAAVSPLGPSSPDFSAVNVRSSRDLDATISSASCSVPHADGTPIGAYSLSFSPTTFAISQADTSRNLCEIDTPTTTCSIDHSNTLAPRITTSHVAVASTTTSSHDHSNTFSPKLTTSHAVPPTITSSRDFSPAVNPATTSSSPTITPPTSSSDTYVTGASSPAAVASDSSASPIASCRPSIDDDDDSRQSQRSASPATSLRREQQLLALCAAAGVDAEEVRALLDDGVNPNVTNDEGRTPLHLAALTAETYVVFLLLRRGADIEARCPDGSTALHCAASSGDGGICVALLVSSGVPVDSVDAQGWTPLHTAASHGDVESVRALLVAGAEKAAVDNCGRTAIQLAANESVSMLLANWKTTLTIEPERRSDCEYINLSMDRIAELSLPMGSYALTRSRPKFLNQ